MFWTDWGDQPQIARANMDGTKLTAIINVHIVKPNGVTIDYELNKIYWADATMDRIEHCDLNGNSRGVSIHQVLFLFKIYYVTYLIY